VLIAKFLLKFSVKDAMRATRNHKKAEVEKKVLIGKAAYQKILIQKNSMRN